MNKPVKKYIIEAIYRHECLSKSDIDALGTRAVELKMKAESATFTADDVSNWNFYLSIEEMGRILRRDRLGSSSLGTVENRLNAAYSNKDLEKSLKIKYDATYNIDASANKDESEFDLFELGEIIRKIVYINTNYPLINSKITIECSDARKEDLRWRAATYFSELDKRIEIYINDERLIAKKDMSIGDLLPMLIVQKSKSGGNASFYSELTASKNTGSSARMRNMIEGAKKSLLRSVEGKGNSEEAAELSYPMSLLEQEKARIGNEIYDMVKDQDISNLAYYMFLNMARLLAENKQLLIESQDVRKDISEFVIEKNTGRWGLNRQLLGEILNNAVAYYDGIIQLVDNACEYSEGKFAVLSIRQRKTRQATGEDEIRANSITRSELKRKFRHKIEIDRDAAGYLEIRVSDLSFDKDVVSGFCVNNELSALAGSKCIKREDGTGVFQSSDALRIILGAKRAGQCSVCAKCKAIDEKINTIDNVAHHYGLRLFRNIVERNNGRFILESGNDIYEGKDIDSLKLDSYYYGAKYSILLPIGSKMQEEGNNSVEIKSPKAELIDYELVLSDSGIEVSHNSEQKVPTNSIIGYLRGKYENDTDALNKQGKLKENLINGLVNDYPLKESQIMPGHNLLCFNIEDLEGGNEEYWCKWLFILISRFYTNKKNEDKKLNIALIVGEKKKNKQKIFEIVKFFSIFYAKSDDLTIEKTYLRNTQIAICSKGYDDLYYVNLIISGENSKSALKSARLFAYYHFNESIDLIDSVKYFNKYANEIESEPRPLFPFDLLLPNTTEDNLFLGHMKALLKKDFKSEDGGCKINDLHIRVGSKVHLKDFYEAELLFHNVANVYKFAYLGLRNIWKEIQSKNIENFIVIGYENYSTILVQQITRQLQNLRNSEILTKAQRAYFPKKIYYAVYSTDDNERERIVYCEDLQNKLIGEMEKINANELYFATFVPVASTQTTFYKIRNKMTEDLKVHYNLDIDNNKFIANNCLVSVSAGTGEKGGEAEEKTKKIESNYYLQDAKIPKRLNLLDTKKGDAIYVDYQLRVETEWQNPNDSNANCVFCDDNMVLAQVDRTSTIPNMIFDLQRSNKISYKKMLVKTRCFEKNFFKNPKCKLKNCMMCDEIDEAAEKKFVDDEFKKISSLEGCIKYGHIYRGNNHYLYYLDFLKYFKKESERNGINGIVKWLKDISGGVESSDFNIIVSPLHETNSPFVKAVIDNAFEHNVRFLHFNPDNTYREDIRTKFSFIAKEYLSIRRADSTNRVKIYFVDDSIVTGATFNRAKMLLGMLLAESGIYKGAFNFDGIFLLINRCSYDTANTMLENPIRDFHVYLHLALPSYNTERDRCPKCVLQDQYELLKKRSASNELGNHFFRLEKKHEKIHADEFVRREKASVPFDKSYLKWLLNWRYLNGNKDLNGKELMSDDLTKGVISFLQSNEQFSEYSKKLYDIINDNPIRERNFDRLLHSCKLMHVIEDIPVKNDDYKSILEETRIAILKLMLDECDKVDKKKYKPLAALKARQSQIIGSIIKVASREYLSRHYHVRQATLDILLAFLYGIMYGGNLFKVLPKERSIAAVFEKFSNCKSELEKIIKVLKYDFSFIEQEKQPATTKNSIFPIAQYQFVMLLLKRLSSFQSVRLLDKGLIDGLEMFFENLINKYYGVESFSKYWKAFGKKGYKDYYEYNRLLDNENPSEIDVLHKMLLDFVKLVKWSTMVTTDDSNCFRIDKLVDAYLQE